LKETWVSTRRLKSLTIWLLEMVCRRESGTGKLTRGGSRVASGPGMPSYPREAQSDPRSGFCVVSDDRHRDTCFEGIATSSHRSEERVVSFHEADRREPQARRGLLPRAHPPPLRRGRRSGAGNRSSARARGISGSNTPGRHLDPAA
jgi:hypothetical protein